MCRDEAAAATLLEGAGAARGARDAAGRTPAHYRGRTRLALPATPGDMADKRNPPGEFTPLFTALSFSFANVCNCEGFRSRWVDWQKIVLKTFKSIYNSILI